MVLVEEYTVEELGRLETGACFVFDIECYSNYFLIALRHITTDKHVIFEHSPDKPLDVDKLRWLVWRSCIVGFNSNNYDILMLTMALWGWTQAQLKALSDRIIHENFRARDFEKEYGKIPQLNHIDLKEVAPLEGSLKLYGGRLHCKHMRELPYEPSTQLTREQAAEVLEYCCNDLELTKLLLIELSPHIELRQNLGREYGRDMRSLSDAQVAEAIIGAELYKDCGVYPRRPKAAVKLARYQVPAYMAFQTPALQAALQTIASAEFPIQDNGSALMPEAVKNLRLHIGGSVYKMGIGGLHSQEKEVSYKADDETLLIDRDVASYYPRIVLNQGLFPKHLGPVFLRTYSGIVDKRLAAKKAGNKKTSEGLKIAINGIFGKFGSIYSIVYAPELLLQVTISGQLSLLMLIEMIELAGIPVVSGNTDGVVIQCKKQDYAKLCEVIELWEKITGFETEETRYKALYSRDVNNYLAIKDLTYEKPDDKQKRLSSKVLSERVGCKVKGVYSEFGSAQNSALSKNPETQVCNDAIVLLLTEGIPILNTINNCKDIKRFVSVRRVVGGAIKNGKPIGKVIRWYYANGCPGNIDYIKTGNKVPKSDNARPLMVLPDLLPSDLNFERYAIETTEMLFDIGYFQRQKSGSLF